MAAPLMITFNKGRRGHPRPAISDAAASALLEIEKGRRFFQLSKPTKRRPNICDSFSAMMPLFSREKSSLKGRRRLETVQDMRSSSSNPVSCSETPIKIYGSKEEIRARKSPETVDAPGFAPDASIPVTHYGGDGEIRTLEPLLTVTRFPVVRPRPTRRHLHVIAGRSC